MAKNVVSGPSHFFYGFYFYYLLDIVASYYCMQYHFGVQLRTKWLWVRVQLQSCNEPNLRKQQKTQFWDKSLPKFRLNNFFSLILPLLVVRHCRKLSLYAISRKTNEPNFRKQEKTYFWVNFVPNLGHQFFFQNLALSVTRYHGQLSSYTTSEKNNNPIFRKLSDRWMDGQTDGWRRVISQDTVRLTSSVQYYKRDKDK